MFKITNDGAHAQWIWNRIGVAHRPECVLFRKTVTYGEVPAKVCIHITADTAYLLTVNGCLVGRGPAKSQTTRYYDTVDLAPYLRAGENTLTVQVVHYVGDPHTANRFLAGPISMPAKPQGGLLIFGDPLWQTNTSYQCCSATALDFAEAPEAYMYLGFAERYDARVTEDDWAPAVEIEAHDGYVKGGLSRVWQVAKRPIPMPFEQPLSFAGATRWAEGSDAAAVLSEAGATVPPHSDWWVELDAGANLTAYPLLEFDGGRDSHVELLYAECYGADKDGEYVKTDRTDYLTPGQYLKGITDHYVAGGGHHLYQPFSYKAFRYLRLRICTADQPLRLRAAGLIRTGYPLEVTTRFSSMSTEDRAIYDVCLRTLQNCMYDTFMDCPHYERMQYVMDTFLQMQYSTALSCDDRLIRKAITDIGDAQRPDGLIPCCVPANFQQIIPGFSLFFIFMLRRYHAFYGKTDLLRQYFPVVERILWFFEQHLDPQLMVCGTGYWQFTDWVEEWAGGVPIHHQHEPNGILTIMLAYALREAAAVAEAIGYTDVAAQHMNLFERIKQAVNTHLYDPQAGLYRDTPRRDDKSQHAQIWAVLAEVVEGEDARRLMARCLTRPQIAKVSFCMEFYLLRALEKVGDYDAAQARWEVWRRLLQQNVTTWPEDPVTCRSECHAWSAVPLYEYTHCGLGIQPAAPGFKKVRISPKMLWLGRFGGCMDTPAGHLQVEWESTAERFSITVTTDRPMQIVWDLPGYVGEETVNGTVNVVSLKDSARPAS